MSFSSLQKPYAFEYGVSDPYTGDHKSQWETKDVHGTVRGSYSLLEPDGTTRIVDYIADQHGFRAVVKKIGIHGHALSVESHGGADAGPRLLDNPIVVAEPGVAYPEPAVAYPAPSVAYSSPSVAYPAPPVAYPAPSVALPAPAISLPAPVPIQQPVVINQEPVIRQPAVYVEEGPAFQSYNGGVQNYQNLIPVPTAQGIYAQQPLFQTERQEVGSISQSYVQRPILAPQAPGVVSQSAYLTPQERYPESYQQQVYQQPPEVGTYQNVPSYPDVQQYEQRLPEVSYQGPIEQDRIPPTSYEGRNYVEPIQNNQIAPPASDGNIPVSSYQFEQAFGEPNTLEVSQPRYSQPAAVSSQNYASSSNLQDGREYVNYDVSYDDNNRYKRDSDSM